MPCSTSRFATSLSGASASGNHRRGHHVADGHHGTHPSFPVGTPGRDPLVRRSAGGGAAPASLGIRLEQRDEETLLARHVGTEDCLEGRTNALAPRSQRVGQGIVELGPCARERVCGVADLLMLERHQAWSPRASRRARRSPGRASDPPISRAVRARCRSSGGLQGQQPTTPRSSREAPRPRGYGRCPVPSLDARGTRSRALEACLVAIPSRVDPPSFGLVPCTVCPATPVSRAVSHVSARAMAPDSIQVAWEVGSHPGRGLRVDVGRSPAGHSASSSSNVRYPEHDRGRASAGRLRVSRQQAWIHEPPAVSTRGLRARSDRATRHVASHSSSPSMWR